MIFLVELQSIFKEGFAKRNLIPQTAKIICGVFSEAVHDGGIAVVGI